VTITASTEALPGKLWRSSGEFRADAAGRVIVSRSPSLAGTYRGSHRMGLFWSMHLVGSKLPFDEQQMFPNGLARVTTVDLAASVAGKTVASTTLTRRTATSGVTERETTLATDGILGCYYSPPATDTPHAAIVLLGGSEGGLPCDFTSLLLASHGYSVLALAYFGAPGLPANLESIPLEYFQHALQWLGRQPGVDPAKITLLGFSRGGEAAMLIGSTYPTLVHAVAEYVGSAHALSEPLNDNNPAWTVNATPITPGTPIPVERISGPMFLVGAIEDRLAPSYTSANIIAGRLEANNRFDYTLLTYDCGHSIGAAIPNIPVATILTHTHYGRLNLGGTPLQSSLARADSWPKLLTFLKHAN
jgi:dienelactone hydrolase